MPELSIIVPVYKVEKYLPKCIDSILAQTFTDFELILIDDGSPDRCGEVCDAYAARDSRIRVIHQKNQGVSAARNAGLDVACGTYLGFVDSDDWIEPEMYETMIATAKEKQVDVVVCGITDISEDGSVLNQYLLSENRYSNSEDLLSVLFDKPNPLGGGCCNKIFVRSSISHVRFRHGIVMAEDWIFLFESFSLLTSCQKIPASLYNVVTRNDSATRCGSMKNVYCALTSSRLLLLLAREHSPSIEAKAIDKYLDDCLRFAPEIREIGQRTQERYYGKLLRIKWLMFKYILRAWFKRLLPKAKIHGYLYEMIRL